MAAYTAWASCLAAIPASEGSGSHQSLSRRLTTDKRYLCAIHLINNQAWIAVVYDCLSLNVLAYNMKRVMRIIGTEGLLKAMAA